MVLFKADPERGVHPGLMAIVSLDSVKRDRLAQLGVVYHRKSGNTSPSLDVDNKDLWVRRYVSIYTKSRVEGFRDGDEEHVHLMRVSTKAGAVLFWVVNKQHVSPGRPTAIFESAVFLSDTAIDAHLKPTAFLDSTAHTSVEVFTRDAIKDCLAAAKHKLASDLPKARQRTIERTVRSKVKGAFPADVRDLDNETRDLLAVCLPGKGV